MLERVRIHLIETLGSMNSFKPSIFFTLCMCLRVFLPIKRTIEDNKVSDGESQS